MAKNLSLSYSLQLTFLMGQLMFGLSTSVDAARLLHESTFANGFENTVKAGTPYLHSNCDRTYWPDFKDPTGGNNRALHANVPGDLGCGKPSNEPKHRAEVFAAPGGKKLSLEENKYYYVGYRLWIPSSQRNAIGDRQYSHHSFPERDTVIYIQGTKGNPRLTVRRRLDWKDQERWTTPIGYDRWNNVVLMNKPAKNNTGEIALWIDGKQIFHRTGVRTMGDTTTMDTKLGIYWGADNRPDDYEMYIDDWRIAEGRDGYDLVNPTQGSAGGGVDEPQVPPKPTGVTLSVNR